MAVDRAEGRGVTLMLKLGGLEPGADRGHRTGLRILARQDDDGPSLPLLIRLRPPQHHAQGSVLEFQILGVQADDLRTPEAARKSKKNDRLVTLRTDVPPEGPAKCYDVPGAERQGTLLPYAEFTADAFEGIGERRLMAIEGETFRAMGCGDRRQMALRRARPELFSGRAG